MRQGISTVHWLVLALMLTTVALLSSVFSPSEATAATYYVATNGSDSNSGTQSAPFRTIIRGLSVLGVGDTLLIRGGTYTDAVNTDIHKFPTGTSSSRTYIKAYPGETPVIKPTGTSGWNIASPGTATPPAPLAPSPFRAMALANQPDHFSPTVLSASTKRRPIRALNKTPMTGNTSNKGASPKRFIPIPSSNSFRQY